jgi:hypothetical protein
MMRILSPRSWLRTYLFEKLLDLLLQSGQIGLDDLPDAIVIYVVVTVDENVSESDNPTEFRYLFSCVWIDLADATKRLADYFKLTLNCPFSSSFCVNDSRV